MDDASTIAAATAAKEWAMAPSLKDEIKQTKPFASVEGEAVLSIIRTADKLMYELHQALRPSGLTPAQYNILRILRGAGPDGATCGSICGRLLTQVPDLTRALDRLEKRGLVSRQRCTEDRRVVHVRILKEGLALLDELEQPLEELHRRQLASLKQAEMKTLIGALEKARDRADIV